MYEGQRNEKGEYHGKGIYKTNVMTYEGDFINGRRTGFGKKTFLNGWTETGTWNNNEREGIVTLSYPQVEYKGIWKYNLWVSFAPDAVSQDVAESVQLIFDGKDPRYDTYQRLIKQNIPLQEYSFSYYMQLKEALLPLVKKTIRDFYTNPTTTEEMNHNRSLMTVRSYQGKYGEIYRHRDMIIKVPKEFSNTCLYEAFVSMCVINPFLETFPDAPLVYTHGFFIGAKGTKGELCPSFYNRNSEEDEEPDERPERPERPDEQPYLCLIQQYHPSLSFFEWVRTGVSIKKIKTILLKVFTCLAKLYSSECKLVNQLHVSKLHHNDLHGSNVIVSHDGEKCWIIDWERASFYYGGKRYTKNILVSEETSPYYELYELCKDIPHKEIQTWMTRIDKIPKEHMTYETILVWLQEIEEIEGKEQEGRKSKRKNKK